MSITYNHKQNNNWFHLLHSMATSFAWLQEGGVLSVQLHRRIWVVLQDSQDKIGSVPLLKYDNHILY